MEGHSRDDHRSGDVRGLPSIHHTGTTLSPDAPVTALNDLVRDLWQQEDPATTLVRAVDWAVQVVPGAEHASVSLVSHRRTITSAASTDDVGRGFAELQQTVGQGPCLDAMYDRQTIRVRDLASDPRWPLLARHWAEVGARSALCLQLFVHGQDLGALVVLSGRVGAFDDESEHWGLLVAAHTSVALSGARKVDGLTQANSNRTVIGQAEGILMERLKISAEVAFALLARISQDRNRKLHRVAEDVVQTGVVPAAARRG